MTRPTQARSGESSVVFWTIVALVAAYLSLFFAAELPSVSAGLGQYTRRIGLLWHYLLVPESLVEQWFMHATATAIFERVPIWTITALITLWAAALGRIALEPLRIFDQMSRLETWVFTTAAGFNLLSLLTLALGLAGLLERWLFPVLAAGAIAVAGWLVYKSIWKYADATAEAGRQRAPRIVWLCAPFALVILLASPLPPADFDVLTYHLQAPKEFFQAGRVGFVPHNVYANMALGSEMLSLLAMVIVDDWRSGALVGKMIIGSFAFWTAAALYAAGRALFSPLAGALAAVIYLSIPWTTHLSTSGLVEGPSALYWLTAVYALLRWRDAVDSAGWLLLSGFLAGAAVSFKYPAALFVAVPLAAWVALSKGTAAERCKRVALFAFAGVAGCGLWFAKNWVLTGNPIYPLGYSLFDGLTRTAEKHAQWTAVHRPPGFGVGKIVESVLTVAYRSEWLSPLLAPLAAIAVWCMSARPDVIKRLCWYLLFVLVAWWLFTHRIDRFWIPVTALLTLLASVGGVELWRLAAESDVVSGGRWRRGILVAGFAFCMIANFAFATSRPMYNQFFAPLDVLWASSERIDPWHAFLNENVSEDGAVLLVGDAAPFDLEPRVYYNTTFDDSIFETLVKDRSTDEIRRAFAERKIEYVYVHWDEIRRYRMPGNYGFTDFVQPEVFERLVSEGVLAPPAPPIEGHGGQVFPVRRLAD